MILFDLLLLSKAMVDPLARALKCILSTGTTMTSN